LCFEGVQMLNSSKQWFKILALLVALVACGLQEPAPTTEEAVDSDTKATATNGLTGVYYDNLDFTGVTKTRVDATINKTFGTAVPITGIGATTYSVRWTGQIMPAFSQTYTFYLTSSDGARLMVNGQVLVNDWVDGASRVRSGTVALVANTKYDIRLEYYRNATNAGAVKLEWQSASRARQVVPTGNLFPTGSNLESAFGIIRANPALQNTGLTFNPLTSVGQLKDSFVINSQAENNSSKLISVKINLKTNSIVLFWLYSYENSGIRIKNLLNNYEIFIENPKSYLDSSGKLFPSSLDKLAIKIGALFSDKLAETAASLQSPVKQIRTGPNVGQPCTNCTTAKDKMLLQLRLVVVGGAMDAYLRIFGIPPTSAGGLIGNLVSQFCSPALVPSVSPTWFPVSCPVPSATDADLSPVQQSILTWLNCVLTNCPAKIINEKAQPATVYARKNEIFLAKVSFQNDTSSVIDLDYASSIQTDFTTIYFKIISGSSGSVEPTQTAEITVQGECPNFDSKETGTATISIQSNDPVRPIVPVPILAICGEPRILVTPTSLSFVAPINSSASPKPLTIQNDGGAQLTGNISTQQSWISVTPSSFNVGPKMTSTDPSLSTTIQVTASCGSVLETRFGTLEITHNATNASSPLRIPVYIQCVGSPKLVTNSLFLTTKVNTSVSGNILLRNEGDADLKIDSITGVTTTSPLAGAKLEISNNPGAVTITPNAGWTVGITGTCGDTPGTLLGYITVASNDPSSPLNVGISLDCLEDIKLSGPASVKFVSSALSWSGLGKTSISIQNLSRVSATYTATLSSLSRVNIVGGATGTIAANGSIQISLEASCGEASFSSVLDGSLSILVDGVVKTSIPVRHICVPVVLAATVTVDGLDCGVLANVLTYQVVPDWFILGGPGYGRQIILSNPCVIPNQAADAFTKGQADADAHLFVTEVEQWELPCSFAKANGGGPAACRRETWVHAKARFDTLTNYIR
jgi:PA14 domain